MIQSGRSRCWKLSVTSYLVMGGAITLTGCFAIASLGDCALAQIIPDTTLGNGNSTVTSTDAVDQIDGGATRDANLFHSFQEFNIGNGRSALFSNPPGIKNILSRVTGANPSNILGTLGVSGGNANLFLINPNGIVFGANASLDVGGSFVASTANALQFGNLGFFSATDKNIPSPLLTINPSALLFNQINQNAAIQNNSVASAGTDPAGLNALGLRVPDGKSLLLVGSNVSMDGGRLNANGGRVELGGLGEPGIVALGVDGDNLSLKFPENLERASVSLTNQAGVVVTGAGGGNIAVNARNLEILEGSFLRGGIGQGLGTAETVAGDITLNATGEIKVAGTGSITESNGGNITINSSSFSLRDGAQLSAETLGQGNAGTIKVNAAANVTISGKSSDLNSALLVNFQSTTGTAGDIIVTSPRVTLDNGGRLDAQSESGNGGNINLQTDLLLLRRGAQISTTAGTAQAGGNAGNINIDAPSGFIVAVKSENSDITANAFTGSGGRVQIIAFGIFGMAVRSREDLVRLLGTNDPTQLDPRLLPTSDITAISQTNPSLSGQVTTITPDVDPSRGLVNLPAVPVETSVAQGCTAGGSQGTNEFIVTGRGGLPPNPGEPLSPDAVQVDLMSLNPEVDKPSTPEVFTSPTSSAPLVEAQGWVMDANGNVVLTANAPTVTPHSSWHRSADCQKVNEQPGR